MESTKSFHVFVFYGPAGAGKTTGARHLSRLSGLKVLRFANPVKDMLITLGLSEAQVDGDRKEEPSALLGGKTPRHAMQTLGTEWRDMIDRELWARITVQAAQTLKISGACGVIIDDCRFPHELHELKTAFAGDLVEVLILRKSALRNPLTYLLGRRAVTRAALRLVGVNIHPSEAYWPTFSPDYTIRNDSFLASMTRAVDFLHSAVITIPK